MYLEEEEMRTIFLFIAVGHRLFGIYLFPSWALPRCNALLSKMWWLGEERKNNWVSGVWNMIPLAILWCT